MDIQDFIDKRRSYDGMDNPRELVEIVRKLHYAIATSTNQTIAREQYEGGLTGVIYNNSQNLFKAAIKVAYPDLDATDIYEVWVDCQEPIVYCANIVRHRMEEDQAFDAHFDDPDECGPTYCIATSRAKWVECQCGLPFFANPI